MKKTYLTIYTVLILAVLLMAGCSDYLDINEDPNSPTEPDIQQLLPGISFDIADDFCIGFGRLGYACAVFSHQIVSREPEYDNYGISGSAYAVDTYWEDLYFAPLQDIELLINEAEADSNLIYAGIGKILKAYTFSQIVDLWGDVPYYDAFNITENLHPEFDDEQEIYGELFALLDAGIADINADAPNILTPGEDDVIYGGDPDLWIKAANTIKLKLYNQVRLTDMYDANAVNTLLADDNLIASGEDFMVPFGTTSVPENRHPAFADEYDGSQISNYISPWFFEIMTGRNDDIFSGINDPRVPYYWVNQLAGGEPENPPEYKQGDFMSIYFGSVGINSDHAGRSSFTMMGLYPVGGKYDDGSGGGPLDGGDAAGNAPQRFITYADRLYIEAELAHTDMTDGDSRQLLEDAMVASFDLVNSITSTVDPSAPLIADSVVSAYTADVLTEFDNGDEEKQLEIIMTQKWIQSFGNSIDQYTDIRRTGYPVIFNANSNNGTQSGGADGSGPVPTQQTRAFPLSFPYDKDEVRLNDNAPDQKSNLGEARVFWDVD